MLERELGEAFSPAKFTVRESEVSDEDFFFACASTFRRRWQAAPSCFFILFYFFFAFGRSSLDRNGSGMFVPSYKLLSFDIFFPEPFHKSTCHGLKMGVPHSRSARLQAGTELQRCWDQDKETYTEVRNPGERDEVNQNKETGACFLSNSSGNKKLPLVAACWHHFSPFCSVMGVCQRKGCEIPPLHKGCSAYSCSNTILHAPESTT